jgi:hypothetical protein
MRSTAQICCHIKLMTTSLLEMEKLRLKENLRLRKLQITVEGRISAAEDNLTRR